MYDTENQSERTVLIAVETDKDAEGFLDELALLAETAGATVVGRLIQKREKIHPGHYFGKGKMDELKDLVTQTDADSVISDDELTAAQQKNMGKFLGVKVMDRTMIILDIFAMRALSAEGKTQVELAQLKYSLSHLTGFYSQLSRQGGGGVGTRGFGIGTRGPGETKLETDRRHIRNRIAQLNHELQEIMEGRAVQREKRERANLPVVSLVGYTNAGKSTLMNALTAADVLAENKLFATLDTTTRRFFCGGKGESFDLGTEALLTDTVGFIRKLPHHLIQAFRATLEELRYADVLLHVVDASNPACEEQREIVLDTLRRLDCLDKPMVTAYNKCDLLQEGASIAPKSEGFGESFIGIPVSAITGENIPALLSAIDHKLRDMRNKITVLIPYSEGQLVGQIHDSCEVLSETHEENGTRIEAFATPEMVGRLKKYGV